MYTTTPIYIPGLIKALTATAYHSNAALCSCNMYIKYFYECVFQLAGQNANGLSLQAAGSLFQLPRLFLTWLTHHIDQQQTPSASESRLQVGWGFPSLSPFRQLQPPP